MNRNTHFIDNQWLAGQGVEFNSIDPGLGEPCWTGRNGTVGEVKSAVDAAGKAFESWAEKALAERAGFLEAFRSQVTTRREELVEAICLETGKPTWESVTEADAVAAKIDLAIRAYADRCRLQEGQLGTASTAVRFRPHGVVAVFGPFNLPAHLPNGHIVPALLAGNTVVLKPSEQAPLVSQKMVEFWQAAGLPRGVLNMIQGGRDTGAALAGDTGIDGLFFTGSAETGKALHRSFAGRPDKILALEMGGNNPLLVHETADVDTATYLTVLSAFITAGQRCTCARRLIVPDGAGGDRFIERLVTSMARIVVDRYTAIPVPFMGPVISQAARSVLLEAQSDLLRKGGRVLVPMTPLDRPGSFVTPGLIDVTNVPDRPDVELFGPFLQLIRVPDFDAGLREADNTAFGLAASLLSDKRELYERFLRKVRAGVINWNSQTTGASGAMPFGGVKASGNHRPSGYYAADYCSYPIASIEDRSLTMPERLIPGIEAGFN